MNIGILGYGSVAKSLIDIIDKKNHKIFVWHRFHPIPRDGVVKKYWADSLPHEMVQKNMIDIVVDALGSNDDALAKSKYAIETALKNEKHVLTCNKRLMHVYGKELCNYAKENNYNFYINSIVSCDIKSNGLGEELTIHNFDKYSSEELFKYRGAHHKETADFLYKEIQEIYGKNI